MIAKIIQSGVLPSDVRINRFTKVLTNSMSLLGIMITAVVFLIYIFINVKLSLIYGVITAIYSIPIILNRYGHYQSASLSILTMNTFVIIASSIIGGFGIEIHPLLIVITLCSSLLFLSFAQAFAFNAVLSIIYVSTRIYSDARGPFIENEVFALREFLNFGLAIIAAFIISRFILRSLVAYITSLETTLEKQKQNNQEIASQNKRLELFNSVAAHDLRTPIRNFTSFASLAKKTLIEKQDQDKTIAHLDMALQYSERMNELINSLASLNNIKRVESEDIIEINLHHQLKQFKARYESQLEKKVQINCDPDIMIKAKLSHCHIIFDNLLQNSIKYNEQDEVIITIEGDLKPDSIDIRVIDNGIGISEEYQEKVFDPFSKLHSPDQYAGSGLGLYIVREILALYQATISVNKNQDIGSTFLIQIPREST